MKKPNLALVANGPLRGMGDPLEQPIFANEAGDPVYRTVSVPGLRRTEAPGHRADEFALSTIQLRSTEQFDLSPDQTLPAEDSPDRFLHCPGVEDAWDEGAATHTEDSEAREELSLIHI